MDVSILPRLATGIYTGIYPLHFQRVSILPRLATGILLPIYAATYAKFLFFPVLRRGSNFKFKVNYTISFYSSPSCDGDPINSRRSRWYSVSILPRLATGIDQTTAASGTTGVSILPRLATGIEYHFPPAPEQQFLFFPVLRRGSLHGYTVRDPINVSILPRLATGIRKCILLECQKCVSILPRLATGIIYPDHGGGLTCFYSSPSCDGDQCMLIRTL